MKPHRPATCGKINIERRTSNVRIWRKRGGKLLWGQGCPRSALPGGRFNALPGTNIVFNSPELGADF